MADQMINGLQRDGWLVSDTSTPHSSEKRAEEAFMKAVQFGRQTFGDELPQGWQKDSGINCVVASLRDSERKYANKTESKALKWVRRITSRILHYGQILDIMSQHHPEYVALIWGALKFLLMGVLNYEALVKELSKVLCRIAEALRHVQVNLTLYPTQVIQDAVCDLYCHIIEFTVRAMKWYSKRRALRALSALASPFQLKFRDIVEDIQECSRRIDRLALTMSQIELRKMRLEAMEMKSLVVEMNSTLKELSKMQYSGILDTNRRISEVQFSQILTFLSTSPLPSPEFMRQTFASRRALRLRAGRVPDYVASSYPQLQEWGATATSSQILVEGSFKARHYARDFAVDMVDLVSDAGIPVVWAFNAANGERTTSATTDILKSLASQVLRSNHSMLNERSASLNAARFQSTTTETGWFALLGSALEGMRQVYFIIDLELLEREGGSATKWITEFPRLFEELKSRGLETIVKVAFVSPIKLLERSCDFSGQHQKIQILSKESGRVQKSSSGFSARLRSRRGFKQRKNLFETWKDGV